jgi:hypothetical protein
MRTDPEIASGVVQFVPSLNILHLSEVSIILKWRLHVPFQVPAYVLALIFVWFNLTFDTHFFESPILQKYLLHGRSPLVSVQI